MGMPNSLGILDGDAKFSREFCMGISNSLKNLAAIFPVQWGIPKITEEVPKSLGNLTMGGCQNLGVPDPL